MTRQRTVTVPIVPYIAYAAVLVVAICVFAYPDVAAYARDALVGWGRNLIAELAFRWRRFAFSW